MSFYKAEISSLLFCPFIIWPCTYFRNIILLFTAWCFSIIFILFFHSIKIKLYLKPNNTCTNSCGPCAISLFKIYYIGESCLEKYINRGKKKNIQHRMETFNSNNTLISNKQRDRSWLLVRATYLLTCAKISRYVIRFRRNNFLYSVVWFL